jgi:hypothetical protein
MKRVPVLHPFLLAINPVLFLFANNPDQVGVGMIPGPVAVLTVIALLLWSSLSLVLKDPKRAGLVVSLFFLLFFSYGVCYLELEVFTSALVGDATLMTPTYLLGAWTAVFALGVYAFVNTRRSLDHLTMVANVVTGCLVLLSAMRIGTYQLGSTSARWSSVITPTIEASPVREAAGPLPDIYYIILDGYARADILADVYDYDNGDFLDYLTAKGLYVARQSRSNYCQTLLSLASSLNLTYLDELAQQVGAEYRGGAPAADFIQDSAVVHFLRSYGYEIVAFASPGTLARRCGAPTSTWRIAGTRTSSRSAL